ncbi:hypothetical protein Tco_1254030 [Tanacetum coccineum]
MLAVCNLATPNVPKAPKPSIAERVPQGTNPGAKPRHKKQLTSSKQPYVSSRETTKDTEMHKEDQQAASGPSSLGATNKEGSHPQLSSGSNLSVLLDRTKSARDGLKTAHTTSGANKESRANDISRKVKLEDLSDILKDTRSAFFTPDSPTDEPIIISDESEEEEDAEKDKDTEDTSVPPPPSPKLAQIHELIARPSYPDINQRTELLVTSLKPELYKLLASHDFASCLPTKLKELPSKITKISGEIKELKQHVRDMEIELPGDLLEIPIKLETFTSTISSLSSQNGPITLKIYREDGSDEVISNLKVSDLHSAEWREVLQAYPDKTSVTEVPLVSALQVLRRLGSIFTSVYAAVQKLKKDS